MGDVDVTMLAAMGLEPEFVKWILALIGGVGLLLVGAVGWWATSVWARLTSIDKTITKALEGHARLTERVDAHGAQLTGLRTSVSERVRSETVDRMDREIGRRLTGLEASLAQGMERVHLRLDQLGSGTFERVAQALAEHGHATELLVEEIRRWPARGERG